MHTQQIILITLLYFYLADIVIMCKIAPGTDLCTVAIFALYCKLLWRLIQEVVV